METLITDLGQVAFPTTVALYLLIERDKTIKRLLREIKDYTKAITELTIIIKERVK